MDIGGGKATIQRVVGREEQTESEGGSGWSDSEVCSGSGLLMSGWGWCLLGELSERWSSVR